MEQTLKNNYNWISPKSMPSSFIWAALAHGALYGAVLGMLNFGMFQSKLEIPTPTTEEMSYEALNEPPAPKAVVRQAPVKEEVPQTPTKADNSPKEMQDKSSTVAGAQTATQAQAPVANSNATGGAGGPAVPYYKIKPKYPRAALVSGTEGWILLKVDVTETGEVENVRIIGGEQRSLFQDEARRAVEKWKYHPFLDGNGKPVRKADHQVRVDFKLKDA